MNVILWKVNDVSIASHFLIEPCDKNGFTYYNFPMFWVSAETFNRMGFIIKTIANSEAVEKEEKTFPAPPTISTKMEIGSGFNPFR